MSEQSQRQELHRKIWSIADDVRGAVDGWDFKQYILGILFYRFISENFTSYIEGGDPDINYAEYPEDMITDDIKDDAVKTKGYFIYPSQLFANVANNARTNEDLNTHLKEIFDEIESSAVGYASENDIKGLFDDVDTRSNRLGNTVPERNKRLADILEGIASLDFGNFEDNKIDLFGDAYEYLISNYASNAGKSGGEFLHHAQVIADSGVSCPEFIGGLYPLERTAQVQPGGHGQCVQLSGADLRCDALRHLPRRDFAGMEESLGPVAGMRRHLAGNTRKAR